MTIGEVLADTLTTKSLTQDEAAAAIGVKQSAVSRWISGKDAPKAEYVAAIVKFTGLAEAKVVAAIHQQRRSHASVPARVTALERELAAVREDLQRVVQLLEAHEPPGS